MAIRSVKLKISGYVQGVGYRYFCVHQAGLHNICGYARNVSDDSVEVEAEGEEESLKAFIRQLERGPAHADVEKVDAEWHSATGKFTDFYVLS